MSLIQSILHAPGAAFHKIKEGAHNLWVKFRNWKIMVIFSPSKKVPPRSDLPEQTIPRPTGYRHPESAHPLGRTDPLVTPPSGNLPAREEMLKLFMPGGGEFNKVIQDEYSQINADVLADYAERVNAIFQDQNLSSEELLLKLHGELDRLSKAHENFKTKNHGLKIDVAALCKPRSLPNAARVKCVKLEQLQTDEGPVIGALNWLSAHGEMRINLESRWPEIEQQAQHAMDVNFSQQIRNIALSMQGAAAAQDMPELLRTVRVMDERRADFFSHDIGNELRIRIFQNHVVSILEEKKAPGEMIEAAKKGDFSGLAGLLRGSLDGNQLLPDQVVQKLNKVIPGMAEAYHAHTERTMKSSPGIAPVAKPKKRPAEVTLQLAENLKNIALPEPSLKDVVKEVHLETGRLSKDGRGAFDGMCRGFSSGNLELVVAGMSYVVHEQGYPVVPQQVYQAVRYMDLKRRTVQYLQEVWKTVSSQALAQGLENTIRRVSQSDDWHALHLVAEEFQHELGQELFSEGQINQMNQCVEEVQRYIRR